MCISNNLPLDIENNIISLLDFQSVQQLASVSKKNHKAVCRDQRWKTYFAKNHLNEGYHIIQRITLIIPYALAVGVTHLTERNPIINCPDYVFSNSTQVCQLEDREVERCWDLLTTEKNLKYAQERMTNTVVGTGLLAGGLLALNMQADQSRKMSKALRIGNVITGTLSLIVGVTAQANGQEVAGGILTSSGGILMIKGIVPQETLAKVNTVANGALRTGCIKVVSFTKSCLSLIGKAFCCCRPRRQFD